MRFILPFLLFSILTIACGSRQKATVYYINCVDCPAGVADYLKKELVCNDYFVADKKGVKTSKSADYKTIKKENPPVYFYVYSPTRDDYNDYSDNMRMDLRFTYDAAHAAEGFKLHLEKREREVWHAYAEPGIFDLRINDKLARQSVTAQKKWILERVAYVLKTYYFNVKE